MTQRIEEQIRVLPAIEPEAHLFKVGCEMFCAESVPRSHNAALKKAESGFDGIGVNISDGIDALAVNNRLVIPDASLFHRDRMRREIVGNHYVYILADILADVLRQRSGLCILGVEEPEIAVALTNADYYFLVVHARDAALPLVDTADVGFVHLDRPVEHRLIGLRHCVTDAMAKIPCGLVAHSESALDLTGGHALFRFAEKHRCGEPLEQRKMGIIENRGSRDGELVVTVLAVEELLVSIQLDGGSLAAEAAWPFGPAKPHKHLAAFFICREQGMNVN